MQPTEEISMIACHFPDRPLMIFFPFKGKTYAMQIKLLQAKVPFHLGKTDVANLMPFLPICRVSACTYETLKIAKRD